MLMTTAKKVWDWERAEWIMDRTRRPHNIGKLDVDFFAHRKWNDDSSTSNMKEAKAFAQSITRKCNAKARVVEATTGIVLFETNPKGDAQ